MVKAEWGTKRICTECGAKFYDLNHAEIICPACSAVFDVEASIRLKRNRQQLAEDMPEKVVDVDDVILDGDIDAELGDDDEGVLEDTSDIDGDDDVPMVKLAKDSDSE